MPSEIILPKVNPNSQETISVPVTLDIFSLLKLSENITSQAQAKISYIVGGKTQERSLTKPVSIFNRNAISWRIPESVCSFVTPNDEVVKEFARSVLGSVNLTNQELPRNIFNAMVI
ncbi:hypothetical protein JGI13_01809, partial [Candidatus Kryptonium thompsonii]